MLGRNKSNNEYHISKRLGLMNSLVVLVFLLLIAKLFIVQVWYHDDYVALEQQSTSVYVDGALPRGDIYDCNGVQLATTQEVYNLSYINVGYHDNEEKMKIAKVIADNFVIDTSEVTDTDLKYQYLYTQPNYGNETLMSPEQYEAYKNGEMSDQEADQIKIGNVTDEMIAPMKSPEEIETYAVKIQMDQSINNTPVILVPNLSEEQIYQANNLAQTVPGIMVTKSYNRVYPYGDTMRTMIGTYEQIPVEQQEYYTALGYNYDEQVGTSYIEKELEATLAPKPATYELTFDENGFITDVSQISPGKAGNDVVLTIDIKFQKEMEQILTDSLKALQGVPGAQNYNQIYAVAIEPDTGKILGISGKQIDKNTGEVYDNTVGVWAQAYEPGSIAKPATLLTGYTYGTLEYGQEYMDEPWVIPGTPVKKSWKNLGMIDENEALAWSSNVYMYNVAVNVAQTTYTSGQPLNIDPKYFDLWRYSLDQYGLGTSSWLEFDNTTMGITGTGTDPGFYLDLATGQYDTYSTMNLGQYAATIASDGYRFQPQYVQSVNEPVYGDEVGPILYETQPLLINEVEASKADIQHVKEAMKCVSTCPQGLTVPELGSKPYTSGSKTGTAETFLFSSNGTSTAVQNSSAIGFAPFDDPEIAIAVMIPAFETTGTGDVQWEGDDIMAEIMDAYFGLPTTVNTPYN